MKNKTIRFRVTEDEYGRIVKQAAKEKRTLSDWLRLVVADAGCRRSSMRPRKSAAKAMYGLPIPGSKEWLHGPIVQKGK